MQSPGLIWVPKILLLTLAQSLPRAGSNADRQKATPGCQAIGGAGGGIPALAVLSQVAILQGGVMAAFPAQHSQGRDDPKQPGCSLSARQSVGPTPLWPPLPFLGLHVQVWPGSVHCEGRWVGASPKTSPQPPSGSSSSSLLLCSLARTGRKVDRREVAPDCQGVGGNVSSSCCEPVGLLLTLPLGQLLSPSSGVSLGSAGAHYTPRPRDSW